MNKNDAWKSFVTSGSVNDYLRYVSIKDNTDIASEEENEFQYRRSCDKGTENKRGRQGNNDPVQG